MPVLLLLAAPIPLAQLTPASGAPEMITSGGLNFFAPPAPVAGCRTEAYPPGMRMGGSIPPPGDYVVWVGNNWQMYQAAPQHVPSDDILSCEG
jgi:hypothetical protein